MSWWRVRAGGVDAGCDSEGDKALEGCLGDAAKAEETDGALWGGREGANLGTTEREWGPTEFWPLGLWFGGLHICYIKLRRLTCPD